MKIFIKQKNLIFYLEHFYFVSKSVKCIFNNYICKMYKLYNDLQLKIVENQDLYRNKDDFRFFFKHKVLKF